MQKSSIGRRSSSNPVRMSVNEREDKNARFSESRRTLLSKSKGQPQPDNSHIPRPRIRSSSGDRMSFRRSKINAKTPLSVPHHRISQLSTPVTPRPASSRNFDPSSGSTARSPSAERASGFGIKGSRKDTRPINDKSYQALMLNKIEQFFVEIDQSALLNSNGSLKPITLKIFVETTACLLKLLDMKQNINVNNYIEELPKIAKKIDYPGTVAKSWLKTANTMHSWPQVLAWLSWLVGVCNAKDLATYTFQLDKLPFVTTDNEEDKHRKRFLAILKMYKLWNEEKLDEEAELLEQYIKDLTNEHVDIDMQKVEALSNLEKEREDYESMREQPNLLEKELEDLKQILDKMKSEEAEDTLYIENTEVYIKQCEIDKEQMEVDCQALKEQIQTGEAQSIELNNMIANQPMSVSERDAIIQKCSEIQSLIHQFNNHVKDIENELYAMDIKFAASNQHLYKAILAYNKDIIMHLGTDTGADLEELKMPETNMLSSDFVETLKSKETALLNLKEHMKKQLGQTESDIKASVNELESLEEKLRILRQEKQNQVEKMTEQKISIQEMQRKAKDTEIRLKEQIKSVQNDVAKLQGSMPDVEAALNELTEVSDKYDAVVRKKEFMEKNAERFFGKFYNILGQHRKNMSELLRKSDPNK